MLRLVLCILTAVARVVPNMFRHQGREQEAPAPGYYSGEVVAAAPPALQFEAVGVAPVPGYFWIGGGWFWEGGRYAWHPGYWSAPRAGYRWVPRTWVRAGGGWRAAGGRWERR